MATFDHTEPTKYHQHTNFEKLYLLLLINQFIPGIFTKFKKPAICLDKRILTLSQELEFSKVWNLTRASLWHLFLTFLYFYLLYTINTRVHGMHVQFSSYQHALEVEKAKALPMHFFCLCLKRLKEIHPQLIMIQALFQIKSRKT